MHNIMIVGEFWSQDCAEKGQPFSNSAGRLLKGLLSQIGINYSDCYATCVFNRQPPGGKLQGFGGERHEALPDYQQLAQKLWVHRKWQPEINRLYEEIKTVRPNVILALGATPLWALTHHKGIKSYRGTPLISRNGTKVLPTYHPSAVQRQWSLRPIMLMDLMKLRKESATRKIVRPRRIINIEPTLDDFHQFYEEHIVPAPVLGTDIETKSIYGPTITEIGFATSVDRAIVVPFWDRTRGNYWTSELEEREAWKLVQTIMETKPHVGQNFNYDVSYLWQCMGIRTLRFGGDTMMMHHSMQPEMEKGLGFLASLYTDEPSWKLMRSDHDSYKDGE